MNKILRFCEPGEARCPLCFNNDKVQELEVDVHCHRIFRCYWCHHLWAPVEEYQVFRAEDYQGGEGDADAGEGTSQTEDTGEEGLAEEETERQEEGGEEPQDGGRGRSARKPKEA